jgi:hypothetical protein
LLVSVVKILGRRMSRDERIGHRDNTMLPNWYRAFVTVPPADLALASRSTVGP